MESLAKKLTRNLRRVSCVLMILFCSAASAATYYVDAASGNDANNGTSTSSAWKAANKVNYTAFNPGDSILFKRGCVWREQLLVSSSGAASAAITFGAYGTGDAPVINGANVVSGWTQSATNQYRATVAAQPEVVVFNGVSGKRETSASALNATNEWYWANGSLMVYATAAPANVEASARTFILGMDTKSYVTVRDLDFRCGSYCVTLYNSSHVILDNLAVHDSAGYAGIYIVAEAPGKAEYTTIRNCSVYNITGSTDALAYGNNGCGIYLYGATACNNVVSNCTVHDNGHEGIGILGGSNNVVADNTVYRSGGSGLRVATETSSGNIIERNTSYQNCLTTDDRFGIDLIRVANNNIVRYNVVHDQHDTLDDPNIAPDPLNGGQKYDTGGIRFDGGNWEGCDNMQSTGNKAYYNVVYNEGYGIETFNFSNIELYNNTIYNSRNFGISIQSVFSVVCSNNVARNNIIHTAGLGLVHHYRMLNTVMDNNTYCPDGPTAFLWRSSDGGCYFSNFSGWKQNSGMDASSRAADPRVVSASTADFALQPASPCLDAGVDVGLNADIADTPVPQNGAVDIGAYELSASAVPVGVTMTSAAPAITKTSPIPVTVTFSKPVTGFTASDVTATNATIGGFNGSGASYSFNLVPSAQGTVTAAIAAGVALDASSGTPNAAADPISRTYDSLAPTVSLTSTAQSVTKTSPILVAVTFNEPVTGFTASDIAATNATVGAFSGSGARYSFTLTPKAQGAVKASIAAGAAADAAGNGNSAGTISRTYDSVQPTVTLSSTAPSTTSTKPIPVTIKFSESVTGFAASDITVTNGTIASFSGSGASYSIKITPLPKKTVTVKVAASVASDAAGNANKAATALSRYYSGS